MKIIVFDTETTGFINKKETALDKQPYIIQFAGILWEMSLSWDYNEISRKDIKLKPPIAIPYGASQVHHIYDIDVQDAPGIDESIDDIMSFLWEADIVIWHNIEYDEDMIRLELRRQEKQHLYNPSEVICTMKSSVDFCQLMWKWERYKYPKLWELYKKLFEEYFIGAHDAMVDVEATLKCFLELYKRKKILLKNHEKTIMSLF